MTFISNRRVVAAIVAASCMAGSASASADAMPSYKTDAAQSGDTYSLPPTYKSDAAQSGEAYSLPSTYKSDAAQSGEAYSLPSTYKSDAAQSGGAPTTSPTTIEVVRPERTIVREVDEALPLILSGSALLLVFAGLGFMLIRTGSVPRLGRSH
jgi:hypothetical protein